MLTHVLVRVRAKLASGEISVSGDQWPMLVYENQAYDDNEPWTGLFRSKLLVFVSILSGCLFIH